MSDEEWNLTVAIRARPIWAKEKQAGKPPIVKTLDNMVVVLDPTDSGDYLRANRSREKQFAFDRVFGDKATQEEIYEGTAKKLVPSVLSGRNATVFAYGATGAGKTFTMLGTDEKPGVMFQTLSDLFSRIESDRGSVTTKVSLSYLEVYNENIRDLLNPQSASLDLREDPLKGVFVANITEYAATSADEIMDLLQQGNRERTVEPTAANQTSSRSHAVLQVVVERRARTADISAQLEVGKLSLIDLAGSERASLTQNTGKRMQEGANINRSLLALANCINALGEKKKKGAFVPYRDSKLTRLLKDSLGGDCRTVMIACVARTAASAEETLNTLKYANRAKQIKIKSTKRVKNVSYHIAEYQKIINELRTEIDELKTQIRSIQDRPVTSSVDDEMSRSTLLLQRRNSIAETEALQNIQDEIVGRFQERMQLRRSIIDLQDTNTQNVLEVRRLEAEIHRRFGQELDSEEAKAALAEIEIIRSNINQNDTIKDGLVKEIQDMESRNKDTLSDIPTFITKGERRKLLELLVRTQALEMGNMELSLQLEIRDKIILDQRRVLEEHNLGDHVNYEGLHFQVGADNDVMVINRYTTELPPPPSKPKEKKEPAKESAAPPAKDAPISLQVTGTSNLPAPRPHGGSGERPPQPAPPQASGRRKSTESINGRYRSRTPPTSSRNHGPVQHIPPSNARRRSSDSAAVSGDALPLVDFPAGSGAKAAKRKPVQVAKRKQPRAISPPAAAPIAATTPGKHSAGSLPALAKR